MTADAVALADAILDLRDEGLGYDAIAARLGVSRGVVAGALFRARTAAVPPDTGIKAIERRLRWDVISAGGCRWVHGTPGYGPGRNDWHWCAAPLSGEDGTPYCAAHLAISRSHVSAALIHSTRNLPQLSGARPGTA